jgi:hypothetical protein
LDKCWERSEVERRWKSEIELRRLWIPEKQHHPEVTWWKEDSKCAFQAAFRTLEGAWRDLISSKEG